MPAVFLTAFSLCAYAEPEEGFVQEGDRSPDGLQGPQPGDSTQLPEDPGNSVSLELESEVKEGPATPVQTSGISLSFGYGFRNIVKSTRRLPFIVELHNYDPADFSGRLEISLPGSVETGSEKLEAAEILYSFDVLVPAGESVTVRDLISAGENGGNLQIRLYNSEGQLAGERLETINVMSTGPELLIGLLSDNPGDLGYFRGISVAGTALRTRVVELDPQELTESPGSLSQIDMIVISDLDSRKLPENSSRMLREWVSGGGALLVGTGARPSTAVQLLSNIRDFSLGDADERDIDMGMKYSKTGPDGAVIRLLVRDVSASSGTQVMQSSDTAILTTIPRGNGIIGVTAYDLCDISAFCSEEIGYVDELLQGLLGTGRIRHMAEEDGGSSGFYATVRPLVGLTDPDRLPSAALYIMFALGYLGLIGFGLYLYLRTRGLGIYYHAFVPIAACAGALVISVMNFALRGGDPAADYAIVREINGSAVSENGFLRLFSASGNDYSFALPEGTKVIPVVREAKTEGFWTSEKENTEGLLEISTGETGNLVLAKGMKPFSGSLLEYSKENRTLEGGLETRITAFDEALSGTIVNSTGHDLENAWLLMYGRIAPVGTIRNGEEIRLDKLPLLYAPTGSPELLSAYITGIRGMAPGSKEYIRALRNTRLLSWYIETNLRSYYGGARLIAFSAESDIPDEAEQGWGSPHSGTILYAGFTDTVFAKGSVLWRTALSTDPKLVSGEYDATANTSRGTVVLEYSLGNDIAVRSLTFCGLSPEFAGEDMVPFTGTIALYNYKSGSYDLMRRDQWQFGASEISPYLSPANTMTVRFVPDESAAASIPMYLPVPDVTGIER